MPDDSPDEVSLTPMNVEGMQGHASSLPPPPLLPEETGEQAASQDEHLYPAPVPVVRWQFTFWRVLTAVALLVALGLILESTHRILHSDWLLILERIPQSLRKGSLTYSIFQQKQRQELNFLNAGDKKRAGKAAKLRAIWEAHPESKVYFANYACQLAGDLSAQGSKNLDFFRQEMRTGMRLDPDNALYHYLLADKVGQRAVENYGNAKERDPNTGAPTYSEYRVMNRRLLEEVIAEILIAAGKPYLRNYQNALSNERLQRMPPPRHYGDYIQRTTVIASEPYPDYNILRHVARMIPYYAIMLGKEGRTREATQLLDTYRPMVRLIAESSDNLIGILVAIAIEKIGGKTAPPVYGDLGRQDLAQQTRQNTTRALRDFEKWRSEKKRNEATEQKFLNRKANLLIAIMGPSLNSKRYLNSSELTPTRNLEYISMEQYSTGALLLLLLALLIHSWLTTIRWRLGLRRSGYSAQWLPLDTGTLTRIIFSIALILVLYYAFTRWSGLAGRDQSFLSQHSIFYLEMMLLFVLLAVVPLRIAIRSFRRRCEEYRIPVKGFQRFPLQSLAVGFCHVIWFLLFSSVLLFTLAAFVLSVYGFPLHWYALTGLGLCVVLAVLFLLPGMRRIRLGEGLYRGTMARSLIPVYALAILLISAMAIPALDREEQHWLRKDTILFYHNGEPMRSCTPLEERVVKDLRGKLLEALGEETAEN
ncbi:MAG: hypothetical protein ACYC7E_18760 [Armatimonadota bacterium]